jgi:diguanylate cyclase (GGDEF)-like protein
VEYRTVFPDGEIHFMMLQGRSVLDHSGEFKGISGVIHDVTERKKQEDQIIYLAFHDELTGLPNPKLFKDRLEDSIDLASRYDQKVATLFFDLDRFKRINDTLGHTLGDRLIRQVADRLVATLRGTDCVSRLGMTGEDVPVARMAGDEFIVLITRIREINDIAKIAKRLVEQMKIPFFLEDHEIFVTATIGISVFPEDGRNAETLLKNADSALHFAKKEGGDRFRFYEQKMNSTAMDRLSLEADLRRALENDEFLLYYQPQVDGSSGNILGVEGLIRWNHPQRGMVAPFHFIPLLEETGQIVEVGDWVLRTACLQQKVWQATVAHPLSVSVNLSVRQFMQSGFVDRVKRIVEETGANPEFLNLEITESLLLDNADSMIKLLKDFRDMGFGISIDDFGTGYSSLSYLKKLPINELKIDRSFVKDIATELDDGTIAKAIISLARNLKLQVIAEGVEEEQQLQFLLNEGCNHIQGFYFGKPVPAGELIFTPGIK